MREENRNSYGQSNLLETGIVMHLVDTESHSFDLVRKRLPKLSPSDRSRQVCQALDVKL